VRPNFFVSIDKAVLLEQLRQQIWEPWWSALAELILMHDPRGDVELRGNRRELALQPLRRLDPARGRQADLRVVRQGQPGAGEP
jgi:hypothetical protein